MAPEAASTSIARLEGLLKAELAGLHGKLDLLAQEIHSGDRETLQAAAALGWRVEQLEKAEKEREEAEKALVGQRRSLRVMVWLAIITALVFPIIVALILSAILPRP